jgi:hypothetical protein
MREKKLASVSRILIAGGLQASRGSRVVPIVLGLR